VAGILEGRATTLAEANLALASALHPAPSAPFEVETDMNIKLNASIVAVSLAALASFGTAAPASAAVSVIAPISTVGSPATVGWGYGVSVSNDGTLAATSFDTGGVTIYEVATGAQHDFTLSDLGNPTNVDGIDFSADDTKLYVANSNNAISVINVADFTVGSDITLQFPFRPIAIEVSPDGDAIYATASGAYEIYKIDPDSGATIAAGTRTFGSRIMSMCVSTDGATLFVPARDNVDVFNTADMTLTTSLSMFGGAARSCEMDNDGNLLLGSLNGSTVMKLGQDGSGYAGANFAAEGYQIFSAVPSCDALYIVDNAHQATIPVLNLSTLDQESIITPDETTGGVGFYGYNGDRSPDGSVIAIAGKNATDGLVVISSPQCAPPVAAASLPDTGADTASAGISMAVAGGMLLAGAFALMAIRRRTA
jgi:LPXTG-motif cell wall-anchored protein